MENENIDRINQAMDYIYRNLEKNLTVEEIADHCCFSKYYFNRVFKSIVGESIYAFIRRMKFESAAFKLRTTQRSITEIAIETGYSPSNFASIFKEFFAMSSSEYRNSDDVPVKNSYEAAVAHIKTMRKQADAFNRINRKIVIKKLAAMSLEYKRFIGNYYGGLGQAWKDLFNELEKAGDLSDASQFIGISYDDPFITDEDHCIYDMCVKVDTIRNVNYHKIAEGYYACYEFHDRLENLIKAYHEIFLLWMPFCGYRFDNRPALEYYRSGLDAEGRIHLDICIPIQLRK
ncbi:MAG TPA: GyrI-like domain-containing protein [Bacillota bacterium]|nr:GyrI-like domain-containing protein [Bacillota bacterium]